MDRLQPYTPLKKKNPLQNRTLATKVFECMHVSRCCLNSLLKEHVAFLCPPKKDMYSPREGIETSENRLTISLAKFAHFVALYFISTNKNFLPSIERRLQKRGNSEASSVCVWSSRAQTRPKSMYFSGTWKILRVPSFGGEVKESVPCPIFAACKKRSISVNYDVLAKFLV